MWVKLSTNRPLMDQWLQSASWSSTCTGILKHPSYIPFLLANRKLHHVQHLNDFAQCTAVQDWLLLCGGDKASIIDRSALDDNNNTVILTSMTVRNYQGMTTCTTTTLNITHIAFVCTLNFFPLISGKPSLASTSATCIYTNLDIAEGSNLLKT